MEEDNNIIDSQVSDLEQLAPIQQPVTPLAPTPQAQPDLEQLTQPAQPVLAPSTVENQNDTTEAQDKAQKEQERYNRIKEQITRGLGKEPTPSQIMDAMDKEDVQSQEAAKQKELALAEEEDNKRLALEARKDEIARLHAKGLPVERNEELDSIIEQQELQAQDADAQAADTLAKTEQLQQDIEQAKIPSKEEVDGALAEERQAQAKLLAEKENTLEDEKIAADAATKAQKQLDDDSEAIKKDPKSGFHNPSFLQKALFIIATSASQYFFDIAGVNRKVENPLEKLIQEDIDAEIREGKLAKEEQERAFINRTRALDEQLKRQKLGNNNTEMQLKIEKFRAEAAALITQKSDQTVAQAQKQALLQKIKSGKVKDVENLSKEDRERVIRLPNGTIRLADSKEAATKLRETKNIVEPALVLINSIDALAKKGSKLSPEDRGVMGSKIQALVGLVRPSYLGPGVMDKPEYKRLINAIGDPFSFTKPTSWELKKLAEVKNKLKLELTTKYKNSGINPPSSYRAKMVDKLLAAANKKGSKKTKVTRASIEKQVDKLVELKKLPEYYAY